MGELGQGKRRTILLHWDTKRALGDACSIRCILKYIIAFVLYKFTDSMCQPDRYLQEEKNKQFENTDPEGSREQVKTSAFFLPLLPT